MRRREVLDMLTRAASECYDDVEARQIAEMVLLARGGITRNQLIVEPNAEVEIEGLDTIVEELKSWKPVQYIIGCADFMDMSLKVDAGVLIPRPETEELVDWISSEAKAGATILDIGTGSGCIAIAVARGIHEAKVWGMDISDDALAIARYNGAKYAPSVEFVKGDALSSFDEMFDTKFDVVVSNPPYIPNSDITLMRPNVVDYEPHTALFVPDNDPLIFYRAIARTALRLLNEAGRLYFEIYESLAEEMVAMLEVEGYVDVVLRDDFRGKPRMICARVR